MPKLSKSQRVGNYEVVFHIKNSSQAETYRVKDTSGKLFFMKLFNYAKLHRTQFDENDEVLEIKISQQLHHQNITSLYDSGEVVVENQKMAYAIYNFISGETIAEKATREQRCSVFTAKQVVLGVLEGLRYMHNLPTPIIHNELTIQNIMIDMAHDNRPIIIDLSHARYLNQGRKAFHKDGLNPFYMAPEAFNGVYSPQTDLFSVGVMLYHLLFGIPPYFMDLSGKQVDEDDLVDAIAERRKRPFSIPATNIDIFDLDEQLINIMAKAISNNVDDRFQSAEEFIQALNGETRIDVGYRKKEKTGESTKSATTSAKMAHGNGFADVIGMDDLKEQLQIEVISLLKNKEEATSLGLKMPNGLLFYGPPGCGKTYFARKFAEEVGLNFIEITCSDIASPFIHGGQTKIASVFDEAREKAPAVLFMDEIDALITDRSFHNNTSESGEVNEFLVQLNNCGEDGVFVIGATNYPGRIDKAALRSGRFEIKCYIPMPDINIRKGLIEFYLSKKKNVDFGIDYDKLASVSEYYNAKEIEAVINKAASNAFHRHQPITMAILEEMFAGHRPDLSKSDLEKFENERRKFEGTKSDRPRIGFN